MRGHGPATVSLHELTLGCVQACLRYQSGFETRTTIIDSSEGRIAYNPIEGMGSTDFDALEEAGPIDWLIAPNQTLFKGLAAWRERYPKARLGARESAAKRLREQTGFDFEALPKLEPPDAGWLLPEGVTNGEAWLQWGDLLLVGEASANIEGTFLGLAGRMSRWAGMGAPAKPPKTWSLVTQAGRSYPQWAKKVLLDFTGLTLVPVHGSPTGPMDTPELLEAIGAV